MDIGDLMVSTPELDSGGSRLFSDFDIVNSPLKFHGEETEGIILLILWFGVLYLLVGG